MSKPNIIFIVLDTLRADRVLSTCNHLCLTPYINKLLNNSIYFENCIANSPWTLPSHISMFTGLYSTQNALISKDIEKLGKKIPVITEILNDMGYYTICYTENAFISKTYGLTRGFDKVFNVWDWNPWIREKYNLSQLIKLLHKIDLFINRKVRSNLFLKIWADIYDRCEKIIKFIIKKLFLKHIIFKLKNNTINDLNRINKEIKKNLNNKPFYLFFNFLTTHDPYIPLKETFKFFNIDIKDFKIIKNMIINPLKSRLDINIKSKRLYEKQIKVIKKLYNACVLSSDIVVKKVISFLKNLGLFEDSYIIITSDHGEHLGNKLDHYFWEHNTYQSVYRSLIQVPLIIFNSSFEKKNIKNQVQLKDLFHTILHLTGIPSSKNKFLEIKKSIIYQINNNSTPKYIYGEYVNKKNEMLELINAHRRTINRNLIPKIFNHLYFLRSEKYKFIKYNNIEYEEFYNLSNDPDEQINIINENKEIQKKMKAYLDNLINKNKDLENLKNIILKKEKNR